MTVGILSLQGDFEKHAQMLRTLGVGVTSVKYPKDLDTVDGLILPGGESTTIRRLLIRYGMWDHLQYRIREGLPVMGTCAGLILLAQDVVGEEKGYGLGVLPIVVERNAYGRQRESFEAPVRLRFDSTPMRGVFIRAPRILQVLDGEVLGEIDENERVWVRYHHVMGLTFHPELTDDTRAHQYFLNLVEETLASKES